MIDDIANRDLSYWGEITKLKWLLKYNLKNHFVD